MSAVIDHANTTLLSAEDERRIETILLRYCTGIDRRDWLLFRSCFTDNFHGDYGQFGTWHSGDEITAVMVTLHQDMGATLHRLTNIVLYATLGGATARSYIDALLTGQDASAPVRRAAGYYDDELVKTSDGWKISRRRFVAVHLV